jgi:hypothetical protein
VSDPQAQAEAALAVERLARKWGGDNWREWVWNAREALIEVFDEIVNGGRTT